MVFGRDCALSEPSGVCGGLTLFILLVDKEREMCGGTGVEVRVLDLLESLDGEGR